MVRAILIVVVLLFVTGGFLIAYNLPNGEPIYLTGDVLLIDSEVYVKDKKVGIMQKRTNSQTGEDFSIGVGIEYAELKRIPRWGVYDQIELPKGNHKLIFKTPEGKKYSMEIFVENENYFGADLNNLQKE